MSRRHIPIVCILVVAALLRLYQLGLNSFWGDELIQVLQADGPNAWQVVLRASTGNQGATPLDHLITHFVLRYLGDDETILRLPAALFGVASVWLVYLLGRKLFDETIGLLAAALLAIAPIHIYYSQEMRFYSLATFMMLAMVYAFARAESRRDWLLFGIVATFALYAHYYALLVLAALGLWVLLFKRSLLVPFAVSAGAAFLLFTPWIWYDVIRPGTPNSNAEPFILPPIDALVSGFFGLVANGEAGCLWRCKMGLGALGFVLLLAFLVAWRDRRAGAFFMPLLVTIVGIAGVLALDSYFSYPFYVRQLLFFVPFVLLLLASIVRILPLYETGFAIAVVALAAFFFVPRIVEMHTASPSADWRAAALYLLAKQGENDVVMTSTPAYLRWYAPNLEVVEVDRKNALATFETLHVEGKTVWIMPYGDVGRRLFAPIFEKYEYHRHPTHRPLVYAIPHPGEW